MFYSHEVLTSRKYGVATVWLVATLGQKSSARKVGRRAILDVDVPKACETIITPDAPMALRLQSSLLYGVSRVYAQQCGYVLADAQHAQTAIRTLMKVVRIAEIDENAAKARPDQITLQDDPAFMPGFNFSGLDSDLLGLDSDLLDLDLNIGGPRRGVSETQSLHTSQSLSQSQQTAIGLELPDESSISFGGGFMMPGSARSAGASILLRREDADVMLPDIDIGLDDEGNFIEFDAPVQGSGGRVGMILPSVGMGGAGRGDGSQFGGAGDETLQDDFLPPIDDGYNLPPPEAHVSSGENRGQHPSSDEAETSSTAMAPQRRKARARKVIAVDRNIELRNRDLMAMNNGYLDHMAEDWKRIATGKNTAQARKNSDNWLLGRGIGGVGLPLGRGGIQGPLAEMWSGNNLYLALTGKDRITKGEKRHDSGNEDEDSSPKRQRLDDDVPQFEMGDDTMKGNYELEVGREAQEPLEDISSAMPWNISASIRGSSVPRGIGSVPGSAVRGSRLVSASPLIGRGAPEGLTSDAPMPFDDFGAPVNSDAFELYGPAADVDTQTAGQNQWQKDVLDKEGNNFLEFIGTAIEEKRMAAGVDGEEVNEVDFEEMLPVETNSKTVAAQALLHVLTLGTKNLIKVVQKEPFAAITLQVF